MRASRRKGKVGRVNTHVDVAMLIVLFILHRYLGRHYITTRYLRSTLYCLPRYVLWDLAVSICQRYTVLKNAQHGFALLRTCEQFHF